MARPAKSPLGKKVKRMFALVPELYWALNQFDEPPLAQIADEALWAWLDANRPDIASQARQHRLDAIARAERAAFYDSQAKETED